MAGAIGCKGGYSPLADSPLLLFKLLFAINRQSRAYCVAILPWGLCLQLQEDDLSTRLRACMALATSTLTNEVERTPTASSKASVFCNRDVDEVERSHDARQGPRLLPGYLGA